MVKKLLTQIKHKTLTGEEVVMDIGAKASNVLPENFVEQKERSNLTAKDKLPVIFGKLSKWYADLRPVAWSGSYSDLTNKPTIPEGSAANYQVANNDTTEAEGFVADARIVRTHGLEIDGLSRDLGGLSFAQDSEGNWGYKIGGADPVVPFNNFNSLEGKKYAGVIIIQNMYGRKINSDEEYFEIVGTSHKFSIKKTGTYLYVKLDNVERIELLKIDSVPYTSQLDSSSGAYFLLKV